MNTSIKETIESSYSKLDEISKAKKVFHKATKYISYVVVTCFALGLVLSWFNIEILLFYIIGGVPIALLITGGVGLLLLDKFNCTELIENSIINWDISIVLKLIIYIIAITGAFTLGAIIVFWFVNIFIQITMRINFFSEFTLLRWDRQLALSPFIIFLIIYFRLNAHNLKIK